MKILQVCLRVPFPPNDGGTIAMYQMAEAYHALGQDVKILSMNTKKHFIAASHLPDEFVSKYKHEAVYLDTTVRPLKAFLNLFGSESYNISRFDQQQFRDKLSNILRVEKFDLIQLESLFVSPYISTIRKYSKAPVVLRSHNVEFRIWERLAASGSNTLKKWYLKFLASRLKNYEMQTMNKFDGILTLTEDDMHALKSMGCHVPILTSPLGLDISKYKCKETYPEIFSVFHLGSMDWLPNIEGVDWFLNEVFPILIKKMPETVVHLAGKNMPARIFDKSSESLRVYGRIEDAESFMSDKPVMIVPLLSGGGMRVKIIEGMARCKAVVSTTTGAEGIKYTKNLNMLIGNTPDEFCNQIIKSRSCFKETGHEARVLVENEYDSKITARRALDFLLSLPSAEPSRQ